MGDILGSDVALAGIFPSFGASYFLAAAALCGHCLVPLLYASSNRSETLAEDGEKVQIFPTAKAQKSKKNKKTNEPLIPLITRIRGKTFEPQRRKERKGK
jgi:hypothetical protein